MKKRVSLALAAMLSITTLYAEGVLSPIMSIGLVGNTLAAVVLLGSAGYIMVAKSPSRLRDLVIIIAFTSLLVSGLDVVLRPIGEGYASSRLYPSLPMIVRWQPDVKEKGQTYGDLAGMIGDPSVREPRSFVFESDAAGFRNIHAGDQLDLLVLGDSFGAGAGTTQDHTFVRLLEMQYGLRVYSLSYPGSPYHEYINFLIELPRLSFKPNARIVWVFYTGNDLIKDYGDIWDPTALPWQDGWKAWMTSYYNLQSSSPPFIHNETAPVPIW